MSDTAKAEFTIEWAMRNLAEKIDECATLRAELSAAHLGMAAVKADAEYWYWYTQTAAQPAGQHFLDLRERLNQLRQSAPSDSLAKVRELVGSMRAVLPLLRQVQQFCPPGDHDELIARAEQNCAALEPLIGKPQQSKET